MTDIVRAELIELCDDELDAVAAAGAYYYPKKTITVLPTIVTKPKYDYKYRNKNYKNGYYRNGD